MLKQEDSSGTPLQSAAQVRVTPKELTSALARLEARQGGLDGTIPLGDAVQELGLNATPEELLLEIEAGRARDKANPPRTRFQNAGGAAAAALLWGILLLGGLFAFHSGGTTPQAPVAIIAPSALLVRQPDHKMALLSEVPDGQPVLCDLAGTQDSARLTDFAPGIYHWTLIKHGGKVYVRGWIGDMSDTALRSTVVEVHPISYWVTEGMKPIRVTLPLGGFQSPPGLTSDNVISASHVVPDGHLKEKW